MRGLVRTAVVALSVAVLLAAGTLPASASTTPSTWDDPEPVSMLQTLLVFVGIPLGLTLLIALMVMAPSIAKGPRYRPGLSWWAEPEWFGGPDEVEGEPARPQLSASTKVDSVGGGASARW